MPDQNEHEKPENLVQQPHQQEREARSLEDAVDSNGTLEGFYAMNNIRDAEEREAMELEKQNQAKKAGK